MNYVSRLRDLQLKQNLAPLRNSLSRAMSGGAKAVSSGRSKLMKGVDAFWNDFERGAGETEPAARDQVPSSPTNSRNSMQQQQHTSETLETATQQAGRLFSNLSSFISRKSKEFSQVMEESISENSNTSPSSSRRTSTLSSAKTNNNKASPKEGVQGSSDDDSAFVDVGQMYPFESNKNRINKNHDEKSLDI